MTAVMEQTLVRDSVDGLNLSTIISLVSGSDTLTSSLVRVMYGTTFESEEVDHAHREPEPGNPVPSWWQRTRRRPTTPWW